MDRQAGNRQFSAQKPFDKDYVLVSDMVEDDYFPAFLVEKVQGLLQEVVDWLEQGTHTYDEIQHQFDIMTIAINALQDEFEENDSEIETVARDSIGESVDYILQWFDIDIDCETAIQERDW